MGTIELSGIFRAKNRTMAEWKSENPVLRDGEIGYEKATRRHKIGDGVTAWNDLPYESGVELRDNGQKTVSSLRVDGGNQYEYTGSAALTVYIDQSILFGDVLLMVPAAVSVTFSNDAPAELNIIKEESLYTLNATSGRKVYTIHAVKPTNAAKAWVLINGAVYM